MPTKSQSRAQAVVTTVHKVETHIGFPVVTWSDTLNGHRRYATMYRRGPNGFSFIHRGEHHAVNEQRPTIVAALDKLTWAPGRDCLASAPWLS